MRINDFMPVAHPQPTSRVRIQSRFNAVPCPAEVRGCMSA